MGRGLLELLSVKMWTPHQVGEMTFVAAGTQFQPPAAGNQPDGSLAYYNKFRFARIQAHDGDLLVNVSKDLAGATLPGTCSIRVLNGTSEIFQLPDTGSPAINVASVGVSAHGAIIWGR